eukprot:10299067-Lingulodinium_polyedra.AAC.1
MSSCEPLIGTGVCFIPSVVNIESSCSVFFTLGHSARAQQRQTQTGHSSTYTPKRNSRHNTHKCS